VNALRKIHDALAPGSLLIDTQPVSAHPPVESDGGILGALDMSDWARTIATIDEVVEQVLGDGSFELERERRYVVTDDYADGDEFVSVTRGWQGTRVVDALAAVAGRERGHVRLHQEIRLRLLRWR
jgi:hypothetical protein